MPNAPGPLKNLQVVNEDGETRQLFGGPIRFVHLDGVGLAPVRRILQSSPLQNGATDFGFRLLPRPLALQLYLDGDTPAGADAARDQLAYIFAPSNSPLQLLATRDDGVTRAIDCYVEGTVDFPMSQRVGGSQPVVVPLIAPDPTWYDPTQQVGSIDLSSGSTSTLSLDATGLTWEDWPVIEIDGPFTTLTVSHVQTAYSFTFDTAIPGGETFVVDLRPSNKTVKQDVNNRLHYLATGSVNGLTSMRVFSQKDLRGYAPTDYANNKFQFARTGNGAGSAARIYWYKRYISL